MGIAIKRKDHKAKTGHQARVRQIADIQIHYMSKEPNNVSDYWKRNGFGSGQNQNLHGIKQGQVQTPDSDIKFSRGTVQEDRDNC